MKKALLLVAAPLLLLSLAAYAPQDRNPQWMPLKNTMGELTLVTGEEVSGLVFTVTPTAVELIVGPAAQRIDGRTFYPSLHINPDHVVSWQQFKPDEKK